MGDDLHRARGEFQRAGVQALSREMQIAHDGLRVLAAGTGGFSALDTADFDGAFDRLVEENSSYYPAGLLLDQRPAQGKTRRIDVRAPRRRARHRPRQLHRAAGRPPQSAARPGAGRSRRAAGFAAQPAAASGSTLGGHGRPVSRQREERFGRRRGGDARRRTRG